MQTPATPLGTHHGARHEDTILLIGHGSREPSGNQEIEDFAQAWRAQWKHALVVSTLGPAAYMLVLTALQLAPLSHVAPAREVSMLFAALIGGQLLGEGVELVAEQGQLTVSAGQSLQNFDRITPPFQELSATSESTSSSA